MHGSGGRGEGGCGLGGGRERREGMCVGSEGLVLLVLVARRGVE
jgi:hypothetical protein